MSSDVDINLLHIKLAKVEDRVQVLENIVKQLLPADFYQAKPQVAYKPFDQCSDLEEWEEQFK